MPIKKSLALVPVALSAGFANAAAIDVTDIVADIGAQAAPIALIGGAVLVLLVGIKAFKWVRRAMS
jgi:pseudouridine-5'-phosphate glycosidase